MCLGWVVFGLCLQIGERIATLHKQDKRNTQKPSSQTSRIVWLINSCSQDPNWNCCQQENSAGWVNSTRGSTVVVGMGWGRGNLYGAIEGALPVCPPPIFLPLPSSAHRRCSRTAARSLAGRARGRRARRAARRRARRARESGRWGLFFWGGLGVGCATPLSRCLERKSIAPVRLSTSLCILIITPSTVSPCKRFILSTRQ